MAPVIDPGAEKLSDVEVPQDASPSGLVAPTYLATAYRWGWIEQWYHVYAGPDRVKAIALAEAEVSHRGGKYNCAVLEFDGTGIEMRQIGYFCGTCDDERPRINNRANYYERIGAFVDSAMRGKCLLPCPTEAGRLTYQDVPELPAYLREEVERQRALLKAMEEVGL